MKINHIVSSIDNSAGGPSRSVTQLIDAMLLEDHEICIELGSLRSEDPIISEFAKLNGKIKFYPIELIGYSELLNIDLKKSRAILFHGHGLWEFPVHQMAKVARKKETPYIITPRGMLEPWSLKQGRIKKLIALKLFQYCDLKNAACLHATAPMEVESIRELGLKNPIAMIPNGIDLSDFQSEPPIKLKHPKKILFLSRIHPKKGIENLIHAWRLIDEKITNNWIIEIIGNGESNYIQELQNQIAHGQMQEQIFIKNPVFGKDKINTFREASLFVLPTHSENFGIVIAEALASHTPVITTKGAPWEELESYNCGWWINIGVEPLKLALEKGIQTLDSELLEMGLNGRKLIEEKYSMESVAKNMIELYYWILTKQNKPSFVYTL